MIHYVQSRFKPLKTKTVSRWWWALKRRGPRGCGAVAEGMWPRGCGRGVVAEGLWPRGYGRGAMAERGSLVKGGVTTLSTQKQKGQKSCRY